MQRIFRNYRRVILPLVLVIILDLSLLGSNFYLSDQLEIASVNINMAGRQRMLSQRITKAVMMAYYYRSNDLPIKPAVDEINQASSLFNQTLLAFKQGGRAVSTTSQQIYIESLTGSRIRQLIDEALILWLPIYQAISADLAGDYLDERELAELIGLLSKENLHLLKLMNDITNELANAARRQTYFLRGLQTIVVILILLSFITASLRLSRHEKYYRKLMESGSDIILGINVKTARITFASDSTTRLLGYDQETIKAMAVQDFFNASAREQINRILQQAASSGRLESERHEIELLRQDGTSLVGDMLLQLQNSEDGHYLELIADIRDITFQKEIEYQLSQMAHSDALTGLANRKKFFDLAEVILIKANRQQNQCAIFFIDLDGFKQINDTYGHEAGDKVLMEVAVRIRNCLRASDVVGRIGGDEFVVMIDEVRARDEMQSLAEKIIEAISAEIHIFRVQHQISASIGLAFYPEHGFDINTLVNHADQAMYRVKNSGKNGVAIYAPQTDRDIAD